MIDSAYLERHPRSHVDTTAGTCGGAVDERCAKPAAWQLSRPWGGTTLRGYCTPHAVRRLAADQIVERMHEQAQLRRAHARLETPA